MDIKQILSNRELATAAGVSPATISYIRNNRGKGISRKLAERLEEETGVPREAWLWSDRWHNPYIKGSNHLLPDASQYAGKKFKR